MSAVGASDGFDCFLGGVLTGVLWHAVGIQKKNACCLLLREPIVSELAGEPETNAVPVPFCGSCFGLVQPLLAGWRGEAQAVRVCLVFSFGGEHGL